MEKPEFLMFRKMSKSAKAEFLSKLASGEYTLSEQIYTPQPPLTFMKLPDGKFKCLQDERILSYEEIKAFPGYTIKDGLLHGSLAVVETVSGKSFSDRNFIRLTPIDDEMFLNALLVPRNSMSIDLESPDPQRPFRDKKTGECYSFSELHKISAEDQFVIYMNYETSKRYKEELEKFC